MNEITNIRWEYDDVSDKAWYNFEYKGIRMLKLISDNDDTPLLNNNEQSKEWIWKEYGWAISYLMDGEIQLKNH